MASYNIGSVTEAIYQMVSELPTTLSGTNLNVFATQSRILVSNFTQQSLDFPVDEKFFGPIVKIAAGLTLSAKVGIGVDVSSITLGELTIDKGAQNPESVLAQGWIDIGKFELSQLGRRVSFTKTFG